MKRTIAVLVISLGLGVAGLAIVGGEALWTTATYRPTRLDLPMALVIVTTLVAQWLAPLFRVRYLVLVHGYRVTRLDAWLAHVAMVMGTALTPGGSGGAPALAAALARVGVPLGTGMGVAMQVGVLDLVMFAWLIPLGLVLRVAGTSLSVPWQQIATGIAGAGAASAVAIALVRYPRPIVAGLLALQRVRGLRRWAARLRDLARGYYRAARTFAAMGPGAWVYLQVVTLVAWLGSFVLLWSLMRSFGQGVALVDVVSVLSVVTLVSFVVPTPGAAGYMEAAVGLAAGAAPLVWWRLGNFYLVYLLAPLATASLWRRGSWRRQVANRRASRGAISGADAEVRPPRGSTRP